MSTGSIRLVYDHACERWLMCEGPADCGSMVSGQVDRCTRKLAEQVRGKASRQPFFFGFLPWPESGIWNKPFFPQTLGDTVCRSKRKQTGTNRFSKDEIQWVKTNILIGPALPMVSFISELVPTFRQTPGSNRRTSPVFSVCPCQHAFKFVNRVDQQVRKGSDEKNNQG